MFLILEYDIIDISEGIDINKTNGSKDCDVFHYWYFKDIGFKYEPYLCNGCHDSLQKAINANNVAIISVKGSDYEIQFWHMRKNETIKYNEKFWSEEFGCYKFLLLYIKMSYTTYYQRNREIILNRPKTYYENHKEVLRDEARNKYRELPEKKT